MLFKVLPLMTLPISSAMRFKPFLIERGSLRTISMARFCSS